MNRTSEGDKMFRVGDIVEVVDMFGKRGEGIVCATTDLSENTYKVDFGFQTGWFSGQQWFRADEMEKV